MKVIKSINNNIAICLDNNDCRLVVFAKGIGYPKIPYEFNDLVNVESTFYNVDSKYYAFFEEISQDTLLFVQKMIEKISIKTNYNFNANAIFVLADHIEFAIKRGRNNSYVPLPYSYDIEYEYPDLINISKWMVKNTEDQYNIRLQEGEVHVIASHLIECLKNDRMKLPEVSLVSVDEVVAEVTRIINEYLKTEIDTRSYNFIRFKTHMKYLIKRLENENEFVDNNVVLLSDMRRKYPEIDGCVANIHEYLNDYFKVQCSASEVLYLFIHVNRLYSREGCNQSGKNLKTT